MVEDEKVQVFPFFPAKKADHGHFLVVPGDDFAALSAGGFDGGGQVKLGDATLSFEPVADLGQIIAFICHMIMVLKRAQHHGLPKGSWHIRVRTHA